MTTFNLTCEAVEATLPDYLDETLEGWVRKSVEEHLGECARCAALARDLRNNAREAAALPALVPGLDPWSGIASRVGAPVIGSEPVAESEPLAPATEPIVVASDASTPIAESPVLPSEPPVLPSESPVLASEPPVLVSEPPVLERETVPPSGTAPVHAAAPAYAFPGRREKRWGPRWMGLARAAALIVVTAGTTFLLTVQWLGPTRAPNVVSDMITRRGSSSERPPAGRGTGGPSAGREQVAPDSIYMPSPDQLNSALTVATSAAQFTPSPEDVVYDKEINSLQRIVRRQKAELDTSTVAVIERNLRTLDAAIAQIRAALQEDPGSPLLGGQASRALEMKVELLRRAAMLRSNTT
jgi:anti-sigma factor RsiW